MRYLVNCILLLFLLGCQTSNKQDNSINFDKNKKTLNKDELKSVVNEQSEFEIHLASIDSNYHPGHIIDRDDTVFNSNRSLVDYVIENQLINKGDKIFISNRKLLPKLKNYKCDSTQIEIFDTLKTGEFCSIFLRSSNFIKEKHKIQINKEHNFTEFIDGQVPYGALYDVPNIEIVELKIELNGIELEIPTSAFSNFYEPNICENNDFVRRIEAFTSISGDYLYLYIYGGNTANTYFSKLIFDKKKYITKICVGYIPLMLNSSFRDDFLGF